MLGQYTPPPSRNTKKFSFKEKGSHTENKSIPVKMVRYEFQRNRLIRLSLNKWTEWPKSTSKQNKQQAGRTEAKLEKFKAQSDHSEANLEKDSFHFLT